MSISSLQPENRLLVALPEEDYQRLVPYLKLVTLSLHQVIYEAGEASEYFYFPHRSVISLVSTMEDGSTIEVGLVGREGMAGLPTLLGGLSGTHRAFVQVAGDAMQISAAVIKREFDRGGALQALLLRYVQASFSQTAQTAACTRFHTIEKRLARWLLSVSDCVDSEDFALTQEFIADMLGTRRSGVTVAASTLQDAGIIRYSRGKISIVDRPALETASCECYRVIKAEFNRLLD